MSYDPLRTSAAVQLSIYFDRKNPNYQKADKKVIDRLIGVVGFAALKTMEGRNNPDAMFEVVKDSPCLIVMMGDDLRKSLPFALRIAKSHPSLLSEFDENVKNNSSIRESFFSRKGAIIDDSDDSSCSDSSDSDGDLKKLNPNEILHKNFWS